MPSYAKFGNIKWTAGWEMNYQLGKEPGTCVIRTVPHLEYLEPGGNLIIGQENYGELVIRDCRLETPILNEDRTWSLPILDRRWKWRYGEVHGSYNIARPDKTFIRERTPRQLAEILLTAMGERRDNWDVGRLPNFARPESRWDAANPATMFDELVTSLGCVWTLDYFRDCVVVWPIGQGVDLPEGPTIARQSGISAVTKPDLIKVIGARRLYQARFVCEAVAKDTDGKIKKLADIAGYNATGDGDPEDFINIEDEDTYDDHGEEKKVRDLAKEWVYRAYRVTGLANGGWSPEELKGTDREPQAFFDLEFIDTRAEQEVDENDIGPDGVVTGRKVNKPIRVMARWYDSENAVTPPVNQIDVYRGHATFEPKLGIVRFSDPLYLYDGDNDSRNHKAAVVYVEVAFYAGRDGLFSRPTAELQTGEKNNTGPRLIVKDDIEERVIQRYRVASLIATERVGDHASSQDIQTQLHLYARQALDDYLPLPSVSRTYYGLVPLVPDGRIRQVTWSGGGQAETKTQVSVNTEHNSYQPTIEDSRRKQAIDDLLKIPAWKRTPDERRALTAQFG